MDNFANERVLAVDPEAHEAARRQLGAMVHAAAFGEIVSVLMASPAHREARLADLERFVSPAVATRQYILVKAAPNGLAEAAVPVGVAFWAAVSDAVDQRLRAAHDQPVMLATEDWRSGDNLWLVDLIGLPAVRRPLLEDLRDRVAQGRPMTLKVRDGSGAFQLQTLHAVLAPQ